MTDFYVMNLTFFLREYSRDFMVALGSRNFNKRLILSSVQPQYIVVVMFYTHYILWSN
jgi:hypothetical protein